MAGPLNAVGSQPQALVSSALQQSNASTQGVRQEEEIEAQQDVVQPEGAEPAEAQTTATEDQDSAVELRSQAESFEITGNEERGSLVDVLI